MGEEGEDLTPDRPVVQFGRAVDQKKTDLQHSNVRSGQVRSGQVRSGQVITCFCVDGVWSIPILITWQEST